MTTKSKTYTLDQIQNALWSIQAKYQQEAALYDAMPNNELFAELAHKARGQASGILMAISHLEETLKHGTFGMTPLNTYAVDTDAPTWY